MIIKMMENRMSEHIENKKSEVENGKFGFNSSDEKQCGWCDIKHICHESVLRKGNG